MKEKTLPPLDETSAEALRLFRKLDTDRKQTVFNTVMLMVRCPGFFEAMKEATPEGEAVLPWEVIKELTSEWMEKYISLYAT